MIHACTWLYSQTDTRITCRPMHMLPPRRADPTKIVKVFPKIVKNTAVVYDVFARFLHTIPTIPTCQPTLLSDITTRILYDTCICRHDLPPWRADPLRPYVFQKYIIRTTQYTPHDTFLNLSGQLFSQQTATQLSAERTPIDTHTVRYTTDFSTTMSPKDQARKDNSGKKKRKATSSIFCR